MISFSQYLIEFRSAPLYHGTSITNAYSIISDNTIEGQYVGWLGIKEGVSLTRNLNVAKSFAYDSFGGGRSVDNAVIFELNQAKLTQNYKIIPYNYWSSRTRTTEKSGKEELHSGAKFNEYEELVSGNIKNIDRYIEKIIVFVKPGVPLSGNSLLNHPKLWYNGKFVNK